MVRILCRLRTKANFLFVPLNGQLFFFLPLRLMQNRSNDAKKEGRKKTVFLTFGGPVNSVFLSVFVSEPSSSGLPWQNF